MGDLGQLIITGISGTTLTVDEKQFLEQENIGGIILFSHNYQSPTQLAELVNSVQTARKDYPLFISVDHEGGRVIRFKKDFTQFPSMIQIPRIGSPKLCYNIHRVMAQELHACGINLDFAPCCDVLSNLDNNVIGDRAFGTDQEIVSRFITAAIRGLQANGILSCAKHFPGHGPTSADSHYVLPLIKTTMEQLWARDLLPFLKAIKSSRVEFVMMAHVIVDCIDQNLPCSLSLNAHQLLRREMKFNRIIISDDLEMKAISEQFSTEEAAKMALKAGTDIILYRNMELARIALEQIKKAVSAKDIKFSDIKEKLYRVTDCKKRNLKDYNPVYLPDIRCTINSPNAQGLLREVEKKITDCLSPE